jgi:glutamate synthase (NADPH), homotetrameric
MPELPIQQRITSFHEEVALGYSMEEAMAEARRCLDCPNPGCVEGCPVGIHIPSFIKLIEKGQMIDAVNIIRETSSLPAVCGRVCPQEKQCESQCIYTLSLKKQAVSIGNLERYVADYERLHRDRSIKPQRGDTPQRGKIAVVGSGPAGLSFATDMAKWGYDVTVYEAQAELGGVLRYGIPEFCLPNSIIEDELDKMRDLGVHFQTNTTVGKTITYEDLKALGMEGIFIATGVGVANYMNIPGEDLQGVYTASEYLAKYNLMTPEELAAELPSLRGKRVAVIGGGNTAIDAVRTAIRFDAKEAMIVYRRGEDEMPARAEEVRHAREEGTHFLTLHNPVEYLGNEEGKVIAMRLQRMELGAPDESGRRRPVAIPGDIVTMPVDEVVVCIGYSASTLLTKSMPDLQVDKWGNIIVNEGKQTSIPDVYAGGDIVRGAATVILAMGDGRRAATAMHQRLTGRIEEGALA